MWIVGSSGEGSAGGVVHLYGGDVPMDFVGNKCLNMGNCVVSLHKLYYESRVNFSNVSM